ncbi:MAG: 50S ribosomal protein L9 [Candidatus Komeilibacteria bacterium RIFCSPLOWO2_02_FULL_48_11]|uniref:Large ribosomal subunit protein bL9 n=1 Tax=Candidatus Komeilibacteria bacterium RIFCSPLOWO2_02_FULL_48_11 TaxID=1798553 RepID=A0A1G2BTY9_9BACT|nr:MAG: 50S ribosomal protein L9 [Candidatus Komeilibacteria bacterium RIFCSPLOWO2_02_FULL_48_11]
MKVILIKQVAKLGNPGDVKEVSPGYARNFLLSKGLARQATSAALTEVAQEKQRKARQKEQQAVKRHKLHDILEGQTILIRATANEAGHLFGGIDRAAIAAAIAKRKKVEIDSKGLELPHHLKTLGKHEVVLELGGGEQVTFTVDVQREE